MPPKSLWLFLEYGLLAWLALFAVVLAYRGLTSGRIPDIVLDRLGGSADPARLQALAVTIGIAGYYLSLGLNNLSQGKLVLPPMPEEALSILAASLGVQLGGKVYQAHPPRASRGAGGDPAPDDSPSSSSPARARPARRTKPASKPKGKKPT
jgi:hypothetical protein